MGLGDRRGVGTWSGTPVPGAPVHRTHATPGSYTRPASWRRERAGDGDEGVERLRVGERAAAGGDVGGRAREDPLHRDLELLAGQGASGSSARRRSGRGRGGATATRAPAPTTRACELRRRARRRRRSATNSTQLVAVLEVHDQAVGDLGRGLRPRRRTRRCPTRTPPRFNVASERPVITHDPRSVIVIQSPWRHTPGKSSK